MAKKPAANVAANIVKNAAKLAKDPDVRYAAGRLAHHARGGVEKARDYVDVQRDKKAEKLLEKQRAEDRANALVAAATENRYTVREFLENAEKSTESGLSYFNCPGSLLFVTLKKPAKQNEDFVKAVGYYACCASNCALEIRRQFEGLGNPDVYADCKYLPDSTYVSVKTADGFEQAIAATEAIVEVLGENGLYSDRAERR